MMSDKEFIRMISDLKQDLSIMQEYDNLRKEYPRVVDLQAIVDHTGLPGKILKNNTRYNTSDNFVYIVDYPDFYGDRVTVSITFKETCLKIASLVPFTSNLNTEPAKFDQVDAVRVTNVSIGSKYNSSSISSYSEQPLRLNDIISVMEDAPDYAKTHGWCNPFNWQECLGRERLDHFYLLECKSNEFRIGSTFGSFDIEIPIILNERKRANFLLGEILKLSYLDRLINSNAFVIMQDYRWKYESLQAIEELSSNIILLKPNTNFYVFSSKEEMIMAATLVEKS